MNHKIKRAHQSTVVFFSPQLCRVPMNKQNATASLCFHCFHKPPPPAVSPRHGAWKQPITEQCSCALTPVHGKYNLMIIGRAYGSTKNRQHNKNSKQINIRRTYDSVLDHKINNLVVYRDANALNINTRKWISVQIIILLHCSKHFKINTFFQGT